MVLIRPNFISQNLCDELIAAFQHISAKYESDGGHVRKWPYRTAISAALLREAGVPGLDARLDKVRQDAADVVAKFYSISDPTYIDYTLMSEMKFGDRLTFHADNEALT